MTNEVTHTNDTITRCPKCRERFLYWQAADHVCRPQWIREFGEPCDVPAAIADDPRLADISWHNDVAPSFQLACALDVEGIDVRLWVAPVNVEDREYDDMPRFQVIDHNLDDLSVFTTETDAEAAIEALIRITNEAATRLLIGGAK
jgi:hypothetical protein